MILGTDAFIFPKQKQAPVIHPPTPYPPTLTQICAFVIYLTHILTKLGVIRKCQEK